MSISKVFTTFSTAVARASGRPVTFAIAVGVIVIWALAGPIYGYSDTWQLIINTGTTIVTFLMVFLIQNTQNRDSKSIHLKLDELIASLKGPRNKLVDIEDASEAEMLRREAELNALREKGGRQAARVDDNDDNDKEDARDQKNRPDDKQPKQKKTPK